MTKTKTTKTKTTTGTLHQPDEENQNRNEYGADDPSNEKQQQFHLMQTTAEAAKLEKLQRPNELDIAAGLPVDSSSGRRQEHVRQGEPTSQNASMLHLVPTRLPGLTSPQQSLSDVRHPGIGQVLHYSRPEPSARQPESRSNNEHDKNRPQGSSVTAVGYPQSDDDGENDNELAATTEEPVLEALVEHIGSSSAVPAATTTPTPVTIRTSTIERERAKTRKVVLALVLAIVIIAVVATIVVVATTNGGSGPDDDAMPIPEQHPTEEQPSLPEESVTTITTATEVELFGDTYPIATTTRLSRGGQSQPISGSIPSTIGLLTALTYLGLSGHANLTGSIPTEIGLLQHLTHLGLIDNPNLAGSIPSEIGLLSTNRLETLALHKNQLSGSIPPEIGAVVALHTLILSDNELSGGIPTEIGFLTALGVLEMENCLVGGSIPSEIGRLVGMKELILYNNQLVGDIPTEIGFLRSLKFVDLSVNHIYGEIPSEIGLLSTLTSLTLDSNPLSGRIPSEIGLLTNLVGIRLDDTQFEAGSTIPSSLCHVDAVVIKVDCDVVCPCRVSCSCRPSL